MLDTIIQHDMSTMLTHQVTTITCHHMKNNIIRKKKKMRKFDQNSYVNKNDT